MALYITSVNKLYRPRAAVFDATIDKGYHLACLLELDHTNRGIYQAL